MSDNTPSMRDPASTFTKGYQPQTAPARPIVPATGVQGGYQPATGHQAQTPPNEGSGVQSPAKKE